MKSDISPPRLADSLFAWYCDNASIEDLHGDVEELFYQDLETHSPRKAKFLYWKRILTLMFSYAMKARKSRSAFHAFSSSTFNLMMFRNYLKIASRNLNKHKFFTIVNVFGLALGMSVTLVFIAMLAFIYTYDDFHSRRDNIYRITTQVSDKDQNPHYASAPAGLVEKLQIDLPGIEKVVPVQASLRGDAVYNEKRIHVDGYFTTTNFLTVFDFPLLKGSASSALNNPNTIVITETEAAKIFGSKDPMGEIITYEPYGDLVVTGILKDIPRNSHMTFEALVSYSTWTSYAGNSFLENETVWKEFLHSYIYLLLPEKSSTTGIEDYLDKISNDKYKDQRDFTASFQLQPLRKIVPGPDLDNQVGPSWGPISIMMFATLGLIILIPACANYVNLSISQSLTRMKEIGVRKVIGGQRKQIFLQFIMETMLTMLMALGLSYLIFETIRTEFLEMIGRTNTLELSPTIPMVVSFILFALTISLFAGVVPAIYFSKLTPIVALKGKPEIRKRGIRLPIRKIVITGQFVLSLGFIMGLVIMLQQYRYSLNFDFGFQQQHVMDVELQNVDPQLFRNEFEKLSSVQSVSMSSHILGLGYTPDDYVMTSDLADSIEAATISIDHQFIPNMGLTILAGKNFNIQSSNNEQVIIVNEEFVKKFKFKDALSAVDETIVLADGKEVHIGGVVKNFHYANLRVPIGSFFFEYKPAFFNYANIVVTPGTNVEDLDAMQTRWKAIGGENNFKAQFFSDELQDAYSFYLDFVKLFGFLGLLAITVACLGLLGTVVFIIRNRLKEVSIRKVMGASTEHLALILSKDFMILMVIASIITVPGVYFLFKDVLLASIQHYNVEIGSMEIIISLAIMLTLGAATIFSQTLKAANTNPADNLRSE